MNLKNLGIILNESGSVTFSFFLSEYPGQRDTVTVRVTNEWDQIDAEVEGDFDCKPGEGHVISYARADEVPINTALRFSDRYEAGRAVLMELLPASRGPLE